MKIYLASFFEPDNHGPGRKIGITPSKPKNLEYDCEFDFKPFSPGQLYWDYHKKKTEDFDGAAQEFREKYEDQFKTFFDEVKADGKAPEVLPFQDGDTFLSWEKRGNTSYRAVLAQYLMEAGFEVEEN